MLTVVYEDRTCIAVRKPAGMPSQPDPSGDADVLTALSARCGKPLYLVHRLDRVVGGILLFAKDASAAAHLSESMRERRVEKVYLCVCEGSLPPCGDMKDLLFHDKRKGKAFVVDRMRSGVKEASLSYRVLATRETEGKTLCLTEVTLHSGRFHQIRAQFSHRGTPLVGDGKYGSRVKGAVALYATCLTFPVEQGTVTVRDMPNTDTFPWSLFCEECDTI